MAMVMALHKLCSSLNNNPLLHRFPNGASIYYMWTSQLNAPLQEVDLEIADIIELEKARQCKELKLIPSENFTSMSVLQVVGSIMTNKYSEGYPGAKYYGGDEYAIPLSFPFH